MNHPRFPGRSPSVLLALATLATLAAAITPLAAQSAKAAISAHRKAFRQKPPEFKLPVRPGDQTPIQAVDGWARTRLAALEQLAGFHDTTMARYLVKVSAGLERDLAAVDVKRAKLKKAIASGFKAVQKAQKRKPGQPLTTATPGMQKYLKNSNEAGYYRRIRDGLEAEADAVRRQAGKLDPAASQAALADVIGSSIQPLSLKLALARHVAGQGAASLPTLTTALGKARSPSEIAAVVQAIGVLGEAGRPAADQIIALCEHVDSGVREQAALALAELAVPEAIEPMIALVARERGVAQRRIAAALEVLTRQQFGIRVAAWKRWFAAEGAAYKGGAKKLGGGTPSHSKEFNEKNYYYGIRQDGKSILYILDCSGSMNVAYANPRFADPEKKQPLAAGPGEKSRMDACRERLAKAIGMLSSNQQFNILWYNFEPRLYKSKMQPATPKNIQAAQSLLASLRADGGTNIYDSMQLAFDATGRGSYDKAYGVECDMMFLLTDGKPTLAGSSDGYDMVESILAGVRKWNALHRVVIHTIGIGKDLNEAFMDQLATENGGQFRDGDGNRRGASAKGEAGGKLPGAKKSKMP